MNQNLNPNKAPATTVTPDFSHRCADYPHNEIIQATGQIQTVLNFLYGILEPAEPLPPPNACAIERLKEQVNDALYIIDSLNRDIKALAQTIEPTE